MGSYSGIIYVLAGDESKRMERYIYPMNNYIFKISHPASAEHNRTKWDSQGIFRTTNKLIAENNGEGYMIYWNKFEYENPPF
jgi:uracil DNA glycosylase